MQGIADVAFLTLEYGSGTLANLEMSWLAPSKLRRTVIVGSEKMVVYEDGAPEPVRVFDRGVVYRDPETFGEYHLSYRTGDIVSPHLDGSEPLAVELQDFVASIRDGVAGHEKLDLALDVVRMIEAAETSLLDSGAPVRVGAPARASAAVVSNSARRRRARCSPAPARPPSASPRRPRAGEVARAGGRHRPGRRATTSCAGRWRRPTCSP